MSKKGRGVLEDHKKVGNRLKSPWLTEFNWQFVSYFDETIPEIILLGLLNDAHGYARGAELSLALGRALKAIGARPAPLLSTLGKCSSIEIEELAKHLAGNLADAQVAAAPLLAILPEHPLSAFGREPMSEAECLYHLKECVDRLYDKNSMPACAAMANLYYTQARNGMIHIAEGLRIPNLEAIISDPESDDAAHASGTVRMHAQMLVGNGRDEKATDWPSLFWHRCYLASDCDVDQ